MTGIATYAADHFHERTEQFSLKGKILDPVQLPFAGRLVPNYHQQGDRDVQGRCGHSTNASVVSVESSIDQITNPMSRKPFMISRMERVRFAYSDSDKLILMAKDEDANVLSSGMVSQAWGKH